MQVYGLLYRKSHAVVATNALTRAASATLGPIAKHWRFLLDFSLMSSPLHPQPALTTPSPYRLHPPYAPSSAQLSAPSSSPSLPLAHPSSSFMLWPRAHVPEPSTHCQPLSAR